MSFAMEEKLAETAAGERSELAILQGPRAAPCLLFSHGKGLKDQTFYNLFEPNNNKTYIKRIPELCNSYWQCPSQCSHQGWLIIMCEDDESNNKSNDNDDVVVDEYSNSSNWKFGDCFLWNPVLLETIQLPNFRHWINKYDHYDVHECVLSSPPGNPDSMVLFLFVGYLDEIREYVIVYCRPGDKQWSKQDLSRFAAYFPRALFCFKSKLYVDCYNAHLEIGKRRLDNDNETLPIMWFAVRQETDSPVVGALPYLRTHFVESCDELFKVHKLYHQGSCEKQVVALQVLRMNFSLMAWEEVKSLGDHVLFLGERTTASCSAAELGLTRGCVYFTQPNDMKLYTFDLEDNTITMSLPCPNLPRPWLSPDWLIMPMTARVVDGRRRTEDMLGKGEEEGIVIEAEENKTSINDDEKEEEAQKNNGGELEVGIWDILNDNILELIASFLHPVDYMHFRAVSKEIRSVIPTVNWRTTSIEITQTTSLSPWLVSFKPNDAIYNFVDPMYDNEKYSMNLSEFLLDATICASKGSWLLMFKGHKTLFFFNPFTRAMIQLPDLPDEREYIFPCISFSSSPTSSDCIVFAISEWGEDTVLIFFISRGDDSWRWVILNNTMLPSKGKRVRFRPYINNTVFCDTAFYCLDSNGKLGVFNLEDDFSWKVLVKLQRPCTSLYQCFLVECEGKLLSVFVGHVGKWVRIFRLDFSKMVWVEVDSLGKHMLLISNITCLSAVAPHKRMENKIYFPRFHNEGIMFYSLDTGRFHFLGSQRSAQDFYNIKEKLNCCWIEPYWSQASDKELDWLSV
ncbi:Protein of unknown function DUF295 [Macleaya cordata]|uniref:KIB1-4 beta-propeller domain-containing protein n=1 Tax=Macleaya cordata TaxID=56857 RepID=A0A200PSV4_MACCD|nr:Protein of unknown function DUF295 [Macleaya cordata]